MTTPYCDRCCGDLDNETVGCEHQFCRDCTNWCLDCEIDYADARAEIDSDYAKEAS